MTGTLNGRLLVATPALGDPNFDRTIVLVLAHSDEGAVGVVLNRPTDLEVDGAVPGWDQLAADPRVFFEGGPVAQAGVIALARVGAGRAADGWVEVVDGVGTVDLNTDATLVGGVEEVRLFAGYAGWSAGQLEMEIEAGAWFIVDAEPGDALSPDPERLWSQVLRRQPGRLAMLSTFPADIELN